MSKEIFPNRLDRCLLLRLSGDGCLAVPFLPAIIAKLGVVAALDDLLSVVIWQVLGILLQHLRISIF